MFLLDRVPIRTSEKGNLRIAATAPQRLVTNSKTLCPRFLWRWWGAVQQVRAESPIPDHLASGHYYFLAFVNCPITLYPPVSSYIEEQYLFQRRDGKTKFDIKYLKQ